MAGIGFGNWSLKKAGSAEGSAYRPAHFTDIRRAGRSYSVRLWVVRHARGFEWLYRHFADLFLFFHPVWRTLGYGRVEAPIKVVERATKGLLFDCRMCGQCILSSTGMSCPMNCPKQLRNGPCGGVRANGNCEVEPDMPCVWVKAWEGSRNMVEGDRILSVQPPVDRARENTSAWLRVTAEAARLHEAAKEPA